VIEKTKESQYQICLDLKEKRGLAQFGLMSNQDWHDDPKRLIFLLSRYKFVAKLFSNFSEILEIGCADGFGTRVVAQHAKHLVAIDFDPLFIANAKNNMDEKWRFDCFVHDMAKKPFRIAQFDGAYALDVIEHIPKGDVDIFLSNIVMGLKQEGVLIIGTPSLESQQYASYESRVGHVNCMNQKELNNLLSRYFHNVFIFSMNDEVVHTGFYPMAHYLLALCCNKKL
jgi:2-polyprenyl-3-methyl-5-hydroxy-6-metoxy-1,4-benzoquinol methylase